KDGKSLFAASPAQDPYGMAAESVAIGYQLMNGHAPEKNVKLLPVKLITRDNVADYKGWVPAN
ncbi:MAG: transcriptional regulator, partial [Herbaspirillum sp.]|nr:transcriptional regulator [Herbaspirillum sp.]